MDEKVFFKGFASDNNAGVHPLIMEAVELANTGHALGYGNDIYTSKAKELFKEQFGANCETFFVLTGTGANVMSLMSVARSWNSVIVAETAHMQQDECGAPEKFTGCKVLPVDSRDGKITVEGISKHLHGFDFEHHSQPKVVSITQVTEMGTVYTPREISEIADYIHSKGLYLHMDGARIANAAVSLQLPFRSFTTDAGVDIVSFGGTKNGMLMGEAVCFLRPGLAEDFKYIRKQGMQLASKMRFISAQFIAYFSNDLWKECAEHSNIMAQNLAENIRSIPGLQITQPVEANGVFVIMPDEVAEGVREKYFFYPWNPDISEYRLMTSWDTTEDEIEQFAGLLREEMIIKKKGA